ncbi:aldo/keto reductase [Anaerolineales bacterium HSG24]|nr:aldo/keto reductase [Anaerolineales bacterium HSG24]
MFTRKLGRSGLEISAMGMGCWAIGGPLWNGDEPLGWGQVDDQESIQAIHRALDLGITFFDTADVYGAGHSEQVLAKAFTGKRHDVIIATKFGNSFDPTTRQVQGPKSSPDYIRGACENSLRRLKTDYIDLYQFHLNDYDPVQAVEIRELMELFIKEGKIRCYGWSTDFPDRAKVFAEGEHCVAIQHQMNVLEDSAEIVAICEASNLASINRGPLAMGLLTGKYKQGSNLAADDVRGDNSPDWLQYFKDGQPNPIWLDKLSAIREILMLERHSLPQGALAWLWERSEQTIPIPGFRTVAQVEENCAAMNFGPLTEDQMGEIDDLLER